MNVQFETDGPAARRSIENAIERLLAMLDHMEPDADYEPSNDDEPTLGWPDEKPGLGADRRITGTTGPDECEIEDEHGADVLDEPHDDIGEEESSSAGPRLAAKDRASKAPGPTRRLMPAVVKPTSEVATADSPLSAAAEGNSPLRRLLPFCEHTPSIRAYASMIYLRNTENHRGREGIFTMRTMPIHLLCAVAMVATLLGSHSAAAQTAKRYELFGFRATQFIIDQPGLLARREITTIVYRVDHQTGELSRCMVKATYQPQDTLTKLDGECLPFKYDQASSAIGTGNIGVSYHPDFDEFTGEKELNTGVVGAPKNTFPTASLAAFWLINHQDGKMKGCVTRHNVPIGYVCHGL